MSNQPFSEQYRLVAKDWVEKDGAARMLEETKTAVLAQRKAALGDIPDNKAEKQVKSSPEWYDFIKQMVDAKTAANLARVKMEYVKMKSWEYQSGDANKRAEMRLSA